MARWTHCNQGEFGFRVLRKRVSIEDHAHGVLEIKNTYAHHVL